VEGCLEERGRPGDEGECRHASDRHLAAGSGGFSR
jgi:hypothetical protein